ncbi:ectonucleotide pyrophosphatase/phosphodiesterase [Tahibacter amnicola]|uniref:Ectonucleotide pyrophosphatase/phosphodiesterase n=1 Tax=Tahibacter amnicola TaxID=2976241 RepID=A0ABY6BCZ6_9GAMM|nr:ectonucleotide pyrophosphatase/phosphodiesterase [Tahibacter amnicola]UXI67078.1 ectonucleotide pyrophosphatase/phosphodiesterase [Tahibacter amnicola]
MPSNAFALRRACRVLALLCLALGLAACGSQPVRRASAPADPLLLISIDGFRADYLDRGVTPHLSALAATGVRAEGLRPSFPSLTFPNHYTLVTGLYPDHHGIVHNVIDDAANGRHFVYNNARTTADPAWWGGEPIWVGAERQGIRSATMFWPGSDVAIAGVRPSFWRPFSRSVTPDERVDAVLEWLSLPEDQRPRFITLYFEQVDRAGHDVGPDSPDLGQALRQIDAAIGRLFDELDRRGLRGRLNTVVVSDHGQAPSSPQQVMTIDDEIDINRIEPVTVGVVAGFRPRPGQQHYADSTLLAPHPHRQCWRKSEIPTRLHYGRNERIPPIVCVAAEGWVFATRAWEDRHAAGHSRGEHGYDPALPSMRALFLAQGPAFKARQVIPVFDNIDVYPLLTHLLKMQPARHDGTLATLAGILREPPR